MDERTRGSRRQHPPRDVVAPSTIDISYSINNKSVKSENLYGRYTDWDSSSQLTVGNARDECSTNSYERHAAYVDEVREPDSIVCLASPRHKRYIRCETGHDVAQRGRMGPPKQIMSPDSVNAVKLSRNQEDHESVWTSITSSRSVVRSPERRARNSRYEPASKHDDSTITTKATTIIPSLRRRNKNATEPVPLRKTQTYQEYARGMSVKSAQSSHQPESEGWPSAESTLGSIELFRPSQTQSASIDTLTIAPAKPPRIPPRIHHGYNNPTPKADNRTVSPNIFAKSPAKLKQTKSNVSSVTGFTGLNSKMENDETLSIPSALEFVDKSASYTSITSKPQHNDMKYWMDLSVRAAIAVMQAKGSEMLAEKAATTVVEAGRKIQLKEKHRDMQQVLRFLATKTSVAVLEAGGNQRVATAVAHAIMTGVPADEADDYGAEMASAMHSHVHRPASNSRNISIHGYGDRAANTAAQKPKYEPKEPTDNAIADEIGSEVDRSVMLSHIDRSISQKMQRSRSSERSRGKENLQVRDEMPKRNDSSVMRLLTSSTACTKSVNNTTLQRNERTTLSKQDDVPSDANVTQKVPERNSPQMLHGSRSETSGEADRYVAQDPVVSKSSSKNSLLALSRSNVSTEKNNQQLPEPEKSITPRSLAARERSVEDAAKLNAQREQEINEKIAALDAVTATLLARADNMQQFIDQQVAQQQASRLASPSSSNKEHQTVLSGDDPGYHHNFNGKSVQIDDQYRYHPVKPGQHNEQQQQETSVFENFAHQITRMFDFKACASPTTGTQASSAQFSPNSSMYSAYPNKLSHLNCNTGTMGTEHSEAYTDADRNDDMISALTEDVPVQKKWQQRSRINMIANNSRRVNDYEDPQPQVSTYPTSRPQRQIPAYPTSPPTSPLQYISSPQNTPPMEHRIENLPTHTPSIQAILPNMGLEKTVEVQQRSENIFPPANANNVSSPTNQSINQALSNAMRQLSSQLVVPQPFDDSVEVGRDSSKKQSKSSGIGKLKSAFSRKKTPKSVSFGLVIEEPQRTNKEPRSPGRMFGGLGRKKGFEKSEL